MARVAINIRPEMDDSVAAWIAEKEPTLPVLVGADPERLKSFYGVTGAPETFLLDADRRAVFKHVGFVAGDERKLEAQVRLLLELPPFP